MDEVALLEGLLQIYSPTGQEAEAVNYLVARMREAGLEAFVDEAGNAVGVIGEGEKTVMLLGHIDTVPGFIPVSREGDKLSGRGAVDAKGPLACFVASAARWGKMASRPTGKRLVVVGAVGEEGDSRGAHYIKDRYRPSFTIIGEPSGWERITLGYKGSAWFEYRARRALAHTSARNESACEAAVGFWNRVTAWAGERNGATQKVFEQVSPTLRGMQSDSDGFTESAELKFGVRLPPGLSVEELETALRGLLDNPSTSPSTSLRTRLREAPRPEPFDTLRPHTELHPEHSRRTVEVAGPSTSPSTSLRTGLRTGLRAGAELTPLDGVPAYRGEKNTPLVRAFLAAIRKAGGAPGFTLKSGTSDMNIVAPVWGTPIVAYGPGDSALDHTPEEHTLISEYQRAIEALTEVLNLLIQR